MSNRNKSRPRIWKLRVATAILGPLLFLLLTEAVLRLIGYGDPMDFFLPVPGQEAITANPRYTYRYFPKQLVREPDLIRIDKKKSADTYRIFVLGGSAARGTPEPRFGFGRMLEAMLEEAYPGRHFEVVNAALVAINSHVVRRIAKECAAYEPDLFVVYMGNNEVAGPFGAGTIFNQRVPGRWKVAFTLAARSTRTGQLVGNLMQTFGKNSGPSEWLGMDMFLEHRVAADDPRMRKVYDHFEANLNNITETARAAGIPLILSTVSVNLRNCAPLASDHAGKFDDRAEWMDRCSEGIALEEQEQWAEADERYALAEALDGHFAELHFRRARCAMALGETETASKRFETARDLDTLRFRADSEINRIIRKMGAVDSVSLIDVANRVKALPQASQGIPGDELFYEHVHFTFEGNYQLARMIFEETVKQLGDEPREPPLSREGCAERLGYSGWDQYQMESSMINAVVQSPFTGQMDYHERCEKLHAQARSLRHHTTETGIAEAERVLTLALASRPDDLHQRLVLARLQLLQKKGGEAEATLRALLQRLPARADLHSLLGQALLIQGRKDAAGEAFEKSITLASNPVEYMMLSADIYDKAGDTDQAKAFCRRALKEQPDSATRYNRLAEIHMKCGEAKEALENLKRAEKLLPGNGSILFNLARAHYEAGHREIAIQKLHATLKAVPFHLGARMRLGLMLKEEGRFAEASELLSEVVRHEPDQLDVRLHLAEMRISLGKLNAAGNDFRQVLEIAPGELRAALGLAWVLAIRSDATPEEHAEAVTEANRAVTASERKDAFSLDVLAAAWAASGRFDRARACAEEARRIALERQQPDFAAAVSGRLQLYLKNQPYRLRELH